VTNTKKEKTAIEKKEEKKRKEEKKEVHTNRRAKERLFQHPVTRRLAACEGSDGD
jgi:hypothetical protein